MGGRGGGSGLGLRQLTPRGGGGNGNFEPGQVGLKPIDTLKEALGKKGAPDSITEAVRDSNPFYDGSYAEFSENCQRAVVAYEARRRGYDVVAQPTYQGDKLPRPAFVDRNGLRRSYWMGAFQNATPIAVGAANARSAQQRLEAEMKKFGNGARAIMQVHWKNGGGHVLNVENRNGKIIYVDAQVNGQYKPSELYAAVKTGDTQLLRTDNLKFSERAKKSVEPAKRRTGG